MLKVPSTASWSWCSTFCAMAFACGAALHHIAIKVWFQTKQDREPVLAWN